MTWLKRYRANYSNRKALKQLQLKEYKKAINYFKKTQSILPNWSPPIANESLCYFELEEFQLANQSMDKALDLEPNNEVYLSNKLIFLIREEKFKEALLISTKLVNEFEDIEHLPNHGYLLYSLGHYNESIEIYDKLYLKTGEYVHKLCSADNYSKLGKVDESIKIYEEAIEKNPNSVTALNNLGYAKLKKKNYQIAISYFDKVINLQDDYAFAYNNRGFANLKLGKLDDAKNDIYKSIELNTKNSYAYKNLALYFLRLNEKSKAIDCLIQARNLGFKKMYGNEVDDLLGSIRKNT